MHESLPEYCLNCSEKLSGNYCQGCGQKASTHKLSVKHFLSHEVMHGIWHLDKGIFYTLRGVILAPGKLAANYIAGKRAGHFNLGTLLVLLSGLLLLATAGQRFPEVHFTYYDKDGGAFMEFARQSARWMLLLVVPLMAKGSKDILRRLEYNYTEHLVMNGFFFSGVLLILLILSLAQRLLHLPVFIIMAVGLLAVVAYVTRAYRQVTFSKYPGRSFAGKMALLWLIFPFYISGAYFGLIVLYYSFNG